MKEYQVVRELADCLACEAYAVISADNFRRLFPSLKMSTEGRLGATRINQNALDRAIIEIKKELRVNLWDIDALYASGDISNNRRMSKKILSSDISPRVIFLLRASHYIKNKSYMLPSL